ncbi:MAG: 30S ribosomal protein S9 [Phycisphaerales bacterium]|nr:30S ribosomal protein S9 [Phycisphaerales bacterium]
MPAPAPDESTEPVAVTSIVEPVEQPTPTPIKLSASRPWAWGTGRRKTAVARVRIKPGQGTFKINKREINDYFTEDRDRIDVMTVLRITHTETNFEIHVNVKGGGPTGQSGAILLGLARALKTYDPSTEPILREHNLLSRDPRKVERKKYGQRGARRRFQFSKR